VTRRPRPAAGTALLVVALAAGAAAEPLVTVGEVTPTGAVLWARAVTPGPVQVDVGPEDLPPRRTTVAAGEDTDLTVKVALTGLAPATRYAYRVTSGARAAAGRFATAPAPEAAAPVTLLWSGDLGGAGFCRGVETGYPIFRAMARERADFFLFVGDTIYADNRCNRPGTVRGAEEIATTLDGFRTKHRYNREDAAVQALLRGTPVFAIWDDHEVRNDFGPAEPLMPLGRRAFLEYWPILPPVEEPTRLYRRFRWGRLLEVFILDTRQYRSDNGEPDGPGKTMLGAAQRQWLLDGVATSTAVWKIVVSSVPLALPTGRPGRRDSWSNATVWGLPQEGEGFATERDRILRALRARGARNLVVLTADVHHAELIRHHPFPDFSLHEFIAGPLSASTGRPRPLDEGLGPRSLFARGGVNSFGAVTIEPERLTVRLLDEAGTEMFSHTIGPE
jgi:alkaline phosphatase D